MCNCRIVPLFSLLFVLVLLPSTFQQNDACLYDIGRIRAGTFPYKDDIFIATGKAIFDLGRFDRCQSIPVAYYCLVHLGNTSLFFSPQIGLCMPQTCSPENVSLFLENLIQPIYNVWHSFLNPSCVNNVSCPNKDSSPLTTFVIIIIVVFLVLVCLVTLGGVLEYFLGPSPPLFRSISQGVLSMSLSRSRDTPSYERSLSSQEYLLMDNSSLIRPTPKDQRKAVYYLKKCVYGMRRFFEAFSPIVNSERLFASSPIGGLEVLNGVRVLSMFWVILGNTLYFSVKIGFVNFDTFVADVVSTFGFQILLNATYAADIFFFMSGFLVTFHLFDRIQRKMKFSIILFYLHRLWRLTPTYALALVVWWQILPLVVSGPYSNEAVRQNQHCDGYWWTNLLYINNFFGNCFEWGWYLALNWQFSLLSPIFIWVLHKRKTAGYLVLVLTMSASLVVIMIITHTYGLEVHWLSPTQQRATLLVEIMPYARISSYLVGILCGFLILRRTQSEDSSAITGTAKRLKFIFGSFGLLFGCALMAVSIFGTYSLYSSDSSWSRAADITFMALGRFGFVVGLGLVMYVLFLGYELVQKYPQYHSELYNGSVMIK